MCGIFGFVISNKTELPKDSFKNDLHLIFKLSERRGREAAGLAIASKDKISVFKSL